MPQVLAGTRGFVALFAMLFLRVFLYLKGRLIAALWLTSAALSAQTVTTVVAPGTTPTYNGVPIANQFRNPVFLATGNDGTLYFTDGLENNQNIAMSYMRIAPGGALNLINNVPVGNELSNDLSGNIYLNRRVQGCIQKNFNTAAFAGLCSLLHDPYSPSGDGGLATNARLGLVHSIAADNKSNLYIHESLASRNVIRIVEASGTIRQFLNLGSNFTLKAMAVGPDDQLYGYGYTGSSSGGIYRLTSSGLTRIVSEPSDAHPDSFAIDADGNFYFATCSICERATITKVSPSGSSSVVVSSGLQSQVNGMAFDRAGNLFIAEGPRSRYGTFSTQDNPRIVRVNGISRPFPIPVPCTYSFTAVPSTIPSAGGPLAITVTTGAACVWSARLGPNAGTIRFDSTPPANFTGTQTLKFTVAPNEDGARLFEILAGPERFYVTQEAHPAARPPRVPRPPPQPYCTYTIDPTVIRVPATGGTQSVSIRAISQTSNVCEYVITPTESWAVYSGTATLQGNRSISLTFRPNTTTSQRGATVYIGASSIAIIQESANPAPNLPVVTAVVNAASYGPVVTRNSVATIVGQNLAADVGTWDSEITNNRLPRLVNGTRVYINGVPGYPSYVSPTQINFVVPPTDNFDGTVNVEVLTAAGPGFGSTRYTHWAPSFFMIPGLDGKLYPAALFANSRTFVAPIGAIPGVESRPARPGDNIVLYGMGLGFLGPVDAQAGQVITTPLAANNMNLHSVEIGSTESGFLLPIKNLQYVGMTFAGVYQVNFQIPMTGIRSGEWPLTLLYTTDRSNQPSVIFALEN